MNFFRLEPKGYRYESCMKHVTSKDCEDVDHVYMSKEEYYSLLKKSSVNDSIIKKFQKIMKDRANSDRDIHPKKTHTGYIYIYTVKENYKYKYDGKFYTVDLFKTSFQTPYTIEYSYNEAMSLVLKDFGTQYSDCYAEAIGINGIEILDKYEDIYDAAEKEAFNTDDRNDEDEDDFIFYSEMCNNTLSHRQKILNQYLNTNFIIKPTLRANGLTGYYEFIFKHRYEINVPENMMKKRRKKKKEIEEDEQ